jgi:hypothetical protein
LGSPQRAFCASFLHVFKCLLLVTLIVLGKELGGGATHAGHFAHICNRICYLNIPHDLELDGLVFAGNACLARVLRALLRPVIIDHRLLSPLCQALDPREVGVDRPVPAACRQIRVHRFWVFMVGIIHFLNYNTSLGHWGFRV